MTRNLHIEKDGKFKHVYEIIDKPKYDACNKSQRKSLTLTLAFAVGMSVVTLDQVRQVYNTNQSEVHNSYISKIQELNSLEACISEDVTSALEEKIVFIKEDINIIKNNPEYVKYVNKRKNLATTLGFAFLGTLALSAMTLNFKLKKDRYMKKLYTESSDGTRLDEEGNVTCAIK